MRYLESAEIERILPMFGAAVFEAGLSPCQKSKRGVVIFRGDVLLCKGHNSPRDKRACIPPICHGTCNSYCDHAEANALEDAKKRENNTNGASMLHIKMVRWNSQVF